MNLPHPQNRTPFRRADTDFKPLEKQIKINWLG
jgi:hypothetical protein